MKLALFLFGILVFVSPLLLALWEVGPSTIINSDDEAAEDLANRWMASKSPEQLYLAIGCLASGPVCMVASLALP